MTNLKHRDMNPFERRKVIEQMRAELWTFKRIGKYFGVSKQRAHQLLNFIPSVDNLAPRRIKVVFDGEEITLLTRY